MTDVSEPLTRMLASTLSKEATVEKTEASCERGERCEAVYGKQPHCKSSRANA